MTPTQEQAAWKKKLHDMDPQYTANKPLLMVIPEEGIIGPCPVHREGHFVRPSPMVRC